MPKKYLPINLFNIHVRLYGCVKVWMVKIWQLFGRSSISLNFCGAKVSLHTVIIITLHKLLHKLPHMYHYNSVTSVVM